MKTWMTASLLALATAAATAATPLAGRWDATVVTATGFEVPFRFEIAGSGAEAKASFFDGDKRITSTATRVSDTGVAFTFDQYGAILDLTVKDDELDGKYNRGSRPSYTFHAKRYVPPARPTGDVPPIDGLWKISLPDESLKDSKGEKAWRLIVHQSGPQVTAAILRVDGDTGTLTGVYKDGKFVLSHFSGARPSVFEVTPAKDGSLDILQNTKTKLTAVRLDDPRAKELPDPTDPSKHTKVKDTTARFTFNFPDLNGKPVADTDPRFQNKVVLVSITGSWCPNCRDEAPFLASLYKKYRKQGFEIVALAFEEQDVLQNPTRLRNFIKEFGIEYPVLLAGEPEQLKEKVPQGDNLNAFPTAFLLGRDGKVRSVHAGFPSPASGKFYTQAQQELTSQIERLLSERPAGTQ
ncbi:MAG TPA: TlpA disulfide reductase family protein [Nitrospirales bacterium]|nr:TlpA disulfide reductase family protein [Nitrospirales bacterium]